MDEENQSYACFTPSFESNWNENGKNALVEKPPGRPGINNSVVSNSDIYQKIKGQMFYLNMYIQRAKPSKSVQNIQCTHTKVHKNTEMQYKYGHLEIHNQQCTLYTYKGVQIHTTAIRTVQHLHCTC